jgi:RNA polymerase sigma-70 factor (ECF subfamily)
MATAMIETAAGADGATGIAAQRPFAEVARENLDWLYGYCVHLCGDRTDAEDLLQDTLVKAMRAYDGLREPEATKTWLFRVATNCARDRWRARGRELDTVPLDAGDADDDFSLFATIAIEDPFPYSDALHLDFLRLFEDEDIQAVFATMTPAFRAPILLTTIHGFSCKGAAAILGLPLGTLLSRLHRGRKQLERGLWEYAVSRRLVTVSEET